MIYLFILKNFIFYLFYKIAKADFNDSYTNDELLIARVIYRAARLYY